MNRAEHLLSCLAEECAEVAQRVSKALRFGLSEVQPGQPLNNAQRIVYELGDLMSVAIMLQEDGVLPEPAEDFDELLAAKRVKVEFYMAFSREQGVLD